LSEAHRRAYRGLLQARRRINEATTYDDLERVVETADRYFLAGKLTRLQTEAIAYGCWAKSKWLMKTEEAD